MQPLSGGGSSWFHHSDCYELVDDDATIWARLITPVGRGRLSMTFPFLDDPSSSFYAFEVSVDEPEVIWTDSLPTRREVIWTATTSPTELVASPRVQKRTRFGAPLADVHAIIEAAPGAVTVLDARGRARVHVHLGAADPAWTGGEGGVLARSGRAAVAFWLPLTPGARIRKVATSLP